MKLLKLGLRFWITITSLLSFVAGWFLLAHAPKPNPADSPASASVAPLPTLEPLRPLSEFQTDDDNFRNNQPLFSPQPRNQFRPFFTTGGS